MLNSSNARLRIAAAELSENDSSEMQPFHKRTEAMLRRYFQMSLDIGKLPSVLGGLRFRAKVSSYKLTNFEDVVIYVHDMEKCLERLERRTLELIAAMTLMDYTDEETARLMGISDRQVRRDYQDAIDGLTLILIEAGMMQGAAGTGLPPKKPVRSESGAGVKGNRQGLG